MKEQWKKLDSEAKLLVNVEEGRPVPMKIELPISAFVSTKGAGSNCCAKLLTVLRVFVLLILLALLGWIATILYAYCCAAEYEKNALGHAELGWDADDEKVYEYRNKILQSMRDEEDRQRMSRGYQDAPLADPDDWAKNAERMAALHFSRGGESKTSLGDASEEKSAEKSETPSLEKDEESGENDKSLEVASKKEDAVADELAKVLLELINTVAFDEQMSVEEASFKKPAASDEKTSDLKESSEESTTVSEMIKEYEEEATTSPTTSETNKFENLEFATLVSKYLMPIVGENDEMLVWYYRNKNNPDFENVNNLLKVYTAKLLYSTNIAEYPRDMEVVLKLLMVNEEFAREMRMFLEGELKSAELEDDKSMQYRIVDRISTKLNMSKLIKEDPRVLEVFSRMIETSNRLELSQLDANPESLLFGEIAVRPNGGLFIDSSEEEVRRLSVLDAIRRVANEEMASIDLLRANFENVDQENVMKLVNAMKKVAIDDESRDQGLVEFVEETTADSLKEKEADKITEEQQEEEDEEEEEEEEEPVQSSEPVKEPSTNVENDKSEESEDELEKEMETIIKAIQMEKEENEDAPAATDHEDKYLQQILNYDFGYDSYSM